VRDDLFPRLEIVDNSLQTLRTDLGLITYLFYGFDGKLFIRGNSSLSWHSIPIDARRKYPENYTGLEKRLVQLYRLWLSLYR
jgi:hypothetical protein